MKTPKDPNAPKKPTTAYIRYFQDRKPYYMLQNPNMPITEITKLIGREWKELPKEKQQYFLDKAIQDKERYRLENNKYLIKKKNDVAEVRIIKYVYIPSINYIKKIIHLIYIMYM